MITERDFTSVSPSARWMILMKSHTDIPYAREVAELLEYPAEYKPDFHRKDFTFWATTLGLERRYKSIDQLLNELNIRNILELSSGYSFRSLDYACKKGGYYIDTDLPEIIATKTKFLDHLLKGENKHDGKLELLPLNAVDKDNFSEITRHFPPGEIVIVNEGLLAYLVKPEKEKLCTIIHDILIERGGYWITADIGLRNKERKLGLTYNDEIKQFNEQHDTEGNSFESFEEAELFFKNMGFEIDKVSTVKYTEMSSFSYFKRSITFRQFFKIRSGGKLFATWRLKAVL
jgi:hypothetical protein